MTEVKDNAFNFLQRYQIGKTITEHRNHIDWLVKVRDNAIFSFHVNISLRETSAAPEMRKDISMSTYISENEMSEYLEEGLAKPG